MGIKIFDFFSGPWCSAQEGKAGLDARVFGKTIDPYTAGHIFPAVFINKFDEDIFKRYPVQWIFHTMRHTLYL